MKKLDLLVVALLVLGVSLTIWLPRLPTEVSFYLILAYVFLNCLVLLTWMTLGGSASPLRKWLPPFWPWGYVFRRAVERWVVVSIFAVASVIGAVFLAINSDSFDK